MKVLDLLKSFSTNDIEQFEKFLISPYHNINFDVNTLYFNFIKLAKDKPSKIKQQKESYLKTHNCSDAKFRKECYQLIELILEFNTIEQRRSSKFRNSIAQYEAALSRNWVTYLKHKRGQINKLKEEKISWTEIELAAYYKYLKSQIDSNIFSPEESLQLYAEIVLAKREFLKQSDISAFLDLENFKQANYHLDRSVFKSIPPFNNRLLPIYRDIKKMFEGSDHQPLLDKITLDMSKLDLSLSLKNKILEQCTGYLITRLNQGEIYLTKDIYKLYKFGIESNSIHIGNVASYRNIAYFACKEEKFEWALEFIEKYKKELPEEDRQSAYSFTKARTLWYSKDWEGVIRTLRNVEYKALTYNLLARAYILTCYFELDDFEPLDSLIKSFKVYLRRKRNVSKARKDSFYNFITALDHLMKASERSDYKRIIKAKEVIANNPSTRNKDWLTEKIEELEAIIPQPKSKSKANS